jgi:hypothetical protein
MKNRRAVQFDSTKNGLMQKTLNRARSVGLESAAVKERLPGVPFAAKENHDPGTGILLEELATRPLELAARHLKRAKTLAD